MLDIGPDDESHGFKESLVGIRESGWIVAVDVDLAYDAAIRMDGNDDL